MKFKIGDKVRVRDDLVIDEFYGYCTFVSDMESYKGKVYAVEEVRGYYYLLDGTFCWGFTDEMLEPADYNKFEKAKFKPYLKRYGSNVGFIGEKTSLTALFGEELYVGDVVEIYATDTKTNYGYKCVCKEGDKEFVMGIMSRSLGMKNGIAGVWQVRKIKSYKELTDGETIDGTVAILEEEK